MWVSSSDRLAPASRQLPRCPVCFHSRGAMVVVPHDDSASSESFGMSLEDSSSDLACDLRAGHGQEATYSQAPNNGVRGQSVSILPEDSSSESGCDLCAGHGQGATSSQAHSRQHHSDSSSESMGMSLAHSRSEVRAGQPHGNTREESFGVPSEDSSTESECDLSSRTGHGQGATSSQALATRVAPERAPDAAPGEDAFLWAKRCWVGLKAVLGYDVVTRACRRTMTMATHFSGLGSAELAVQMLGVWSQHALNVELDIRAGRACEKISAAQRILQARSPGCCVFQDILSRIDGLPADLVENGLLDFERARDCVARAAVLPNGPCATHGGSCRVCRADLSVDGSPCTPWSRASGGQRKGRSHPHVLLFLAYCRILQVDRPKIVVHENVEAFDVELMRELLGTIYEFHSLKICPGQAGFWFIRRPRCYIILLLCGAVRAIANIRDVYTALLEHTSRREERSSAFLWRASDCDLLEVENRCRSAKGMDPLSAPSGDWEYLLTDAQRKCIAWHSSQYEQTCGRGAASDFSCVWDLSQSTSWGASRPGSTALPTLRRNSSRLWSPGRRRWMILRERAACMGFPVYRSLAWAARVDEDTLPPQAPEYTIGNAMHVANVGIVIAVALACCEVR